MLPKKPREISEEEYNALFKAYNSHENRLINQYKALGWGNLYVGLFLSESPRPCGFSRYSNSYLEPKTGKYKECLPLPENFHHFIKDDTLTTWHFSPAGCPALRPFYSVVECLAEVWKNGKYHYYTHRHRVGKCLFKEKE